MDLPATESNVWFVDNKSDRVVVFLHGLHSDARECWLHKASNGQRSVYWPDLIEGDSRLGLPAVFLAGYHTTASAGEYGIRECVAEVWSGLTEVRPGGGRSVIDRQQIIFICHSTGGVVARYLLTEYQKHFADKTVFLVLLASPSMGSFIANVAALVLAPFRHKLARELRAVSPILEDLDGRFRALLASRAIAGLSGIEVYEHPPFYRLTIVNKHSAGRYFGDPIQAAGETHTSISKPGNRRHIAHKTLVSGVARLEPVPAIVEGPPTTAQSAVEALRDKYGFVWEPVELPNASDALLYWPVRLRRPNLIHAAQAFAAAVLQRQGVKIVLVIDDLGTQDYQRQPCVDRLTTWFSRAGGNPDVLVTVALQQMQEEGTFPSELKWQSVERWLGTTTWKFDQILRVCKLTGSDARLITIQELLEKRPRRLLTPPIVWAALATLVNRLRPEKIITLSGFDERPMWDAWRSWAPIEGRVLTGHLYLPDLRREMSNRESEPIHMANEPLAWNSRRDIRSALRNSRAAAGEAVFEPNSLQAWALQLCVRMPGELGETDIFVEVDGQRVETLHDAAALDAEKFDDAMAIALERVLL
jgi:hypothetical protein